MDPEILTFIRVLVGDTTEPPTFSDEQIEAVYNQSGENSYITAAILLETAAASEALTYKVIRTDDLSVDGVSGAKILLERAKRLRDQAADDANADVWGAFEVVTPFDGPAYWEYEERVRPARYPWDY